MKVSLVILIIISVVLAALLFLQSECSGKKIDKLRVKVSDLETEKEADRQEKIKLKESLRKSDAAWNEKYQADLAKNDTQINDLTSRVKKMKVKTALSKQKIKELEDSDICWEQKFNVLKYEYECLKKDRDGWANTAIEAADVVIPDLRQQLGDVHKRLNEVTVQRDNILDNNIEQLSEDLVQTGKIFRDLDKMEKRLTTYKAIAGVGGVVVVLLAVLGG